VRTDIARAFRHAFVYGGAVAASKAIGFVMIPVYTRVLSLTNYGAMELLDMTMAILGIVLAMGLNAAVVRYYFIAQDDRERKALVSTAAVFSLMMAAGAGIVLVLMAPHIATSVAGRKAYAGLFLLAVLTNAFDAATVVPLAWIRARERSFLYSAIHMARIVGGLALNIWLVVVLRLGVQGVMISGLVVAVGSAVPLTFVVLRAVGPHLSGRALAGMLRYGLPMVPASLSMFVLHFSDRLFLQRYTSMAEVGLYGLAYKFAMTLPFLVGQPLSLMWGPYTFDLARRPDGGRVIARTATYFCVGIAAYGVALAALIPHVMRLIASPRFFASHVPVPALLAGMALLASVTMFETGVLIERRTGLRAASVGAAAVVNFAANWLLIPRMGMMGAAWATTIGCAVVWALSLRFSQRLHPIPYEWSRLAKVALAGMLAFLLAHAVSTPNVWLSLAGRSAAVGTMVFWLWLFRFFHPQETLAVRSVLRGAALRRAGEAEA